MPVEKAGENVHVNVLTESYFLEHSILPRVIKKSFLDYVALVCDSLRRIAIGELYL